MCEAAHPEENRVVGRRAQRKTGKRKAMVVVHERDRRTLPMAFKSEGAALRFIGFRVDPGTELVADQADRWSDLQTRWAMMRIDRRAAYSLDGTYTNGAEECSAGCAGPKSATTLFPTVGRLIGAKALLSEIVSQNCDERFLALN